MSKIKENETESAINAYHGFGREVGLELGANNTTVTMRPNHLAPNAPIVRPVLLHLSLVDISHAFTCVPPHLLFRVHTLDLDQRCVWVLVRLRPLKNKTKQIRKTQKRVKPNNTLA